MLNDPFHTGRNTSRLLFDFSIAISFIESTTSNIKILDIGCGTGWTSEFLNKLGLDVYGLDIDKDVIKLAQERYKDDQRINPDKLHFKVGNSHKLPYPNNFFDYVLFFDSFHHMKNFKKSLKEVHRVLIPSGAVIFAEPGSKHANSPETKKFLSEHPHGKYWIEKSVDLIQINKISTKIGFKNFSIKPYIYPANISYNFTDWFNILNNKEGIKNQISELRRFNYEDRVIFSIRK